MKNKHPFLQYLFGGGIYFVVFVFILFFLQKVEFFSLSHRSFQSIIIEGIIASIVFSVFMYLFFCYHVKGGQKQGRSDK